MRKLLYKKSVLTSLVCSLSSIIAMPSLAQQSINPEEELAYNLGVQAFIYGTGSLTVAAVRQTTTSVDAPMDNAMAPLNAMGKTRVLSGPQDRIVPTVNNDTLYSQAHYDLDLSGPMVIDIPRTDNRYYIVQLLDAYSDSIEDLHVKNVGDQGTKVLLVNKGWAGEVPEGIDRVVESRTPMVWLIQRTGVFGEQLSGDNQYRMTMPADAPADAFWSLTMYDAENLFMVENFIQRYSISTNRKDELKYAEDGTLPICIQYAKPTDTTCNWLPAPQDDFYLHMRLYEPTQAVLDNEYPLPQVEKL